jgi:hydroxypyruvate isomerase
VPGRHEINESQGLIHRAIAGPLADSGYSGYVAHEFVPTPADPLESLARAVRVCSV